MLAEESQSDKVIGFAHKVLLAKKGLINDFDLSNVVHTESPLSSPSISISAPATSSSLSSSSSAGSSSTCLAFLRDPVAPAGSAVTEKEQDVVIE